MPGTLGDMLVKSKLSPHNGSVALRQMNPIHMKGPESFFFQVLNAVFLHGDH